MFNSRLSLSQKWFDFVGAMLATIAILLLTTHPAAAHHPFGGQTPSNFLEGFLSGLGHPVIGLDHLVFVVAIGLLAATQKQAGLAIPVAFILTAMVGTSLHLGSFDLPALEIAISLSVLVFGLMLAMKETPTIMAIVALAAIAGIFHGYAYGEAIVGAEMTPLVAYLAGFSAIQMAIALLSRAMGQLALRKATEQPVFALRFAGFTICGIGAAFLATAAIG